MKISELKIATCAVELPRPYTRKEAIALAESWGLTFTKFINFPPRRATFIVVYAGEYMLQSVLTSAVFKNNIIKLTDIEP